MREKIKLESSAGTGHFYTTSKNKKLMPEKMEIKKFDPVARKHVMYKETKLKRRRTKPREARLRARRHPGEGRDPSFRIPSATISLLRPRPPPGRRLRRGDA